MPTKITVNATTGETQEIEMTGAELAAFNAQLAVHDIAYSASAHIEARVRTTTAAATEIYRATLPTATAFRADLEITGISDDLGSFRYVQATCIVGRGASGGAVIIPTRVGAAAGTIVADHALGAGGAWPAPALVAVGNDVVIRVTGGALGVNWLCVGGVVSFTPAGVQVG